MKHIIKATKLDRNTFNIEVDKSNYKHILKLLEKERMKIINKLKEYQLAGLIGTIKFPRNKYIQAELDILVDKKRVIKKSTEVINKLFKHY